MTKSAITIQLLNDYSISSIPINSSITNQVNPMNQLYKSSTICHIILKLGCNKIITYKICCNNKKDIGHNQKTISFLNWKFYRNLLAQVPIERVADDVNEKCGKMLLAWS